MTIRKDNVEYHAGYRAFASGVRDTDCPYNYRDSISDDCRYNRWQLGWLDARSKASGPSMWEETPYGEELCRNGVAIADCNCC